MPFPLAIFDLDGTLIDSRQGVSYCLHQVLHEFVDPDRDIPSSELNDYLVAPLPESLTHLGVCATELDAAIELFQEQFQSEGMQRSGVFPGARDVLDHLQQTGWMLMAATSRPEVLAHAELKHQQLEGYFTAVFSPHPAQPRQTKSRSIELALAYAGQEVSAAVMVGDRHHDAIGAADNGILAIIVRWGYAGHDEFDGIENIVAVETMAELQDALTRLPTATPAAGLHTQSSPCTLS